MSKELKQIIQYDIDRGYDTGKLITPLQLKFIVTWRKAVYYGRKHPLGIWYRLRLDHISKKSGIQIPTDTKIGKGLLIAHFGTIIINPSAVMGDNINIAPNVVIGKANRGEKKGVPTIGNDVWIGAGAVIIGNINIGNDVLIAPNAFVNKDVPDHSIVLGNPAVIHHREDATKDYINHRV